MRILFGFVVLALAIAAAAADEQKGGGKKHEYTLDKLPNVVKVKAGESIVVTHNIKPADVEETKARSDNADVTVQGKAVNGAVQITIGSAKKEKAKVGWEIHQINGRVDGRKELQVEFE
jgi:hypothetical protein